MRTEYKEGDLLTKEDIGLVFKSREDREWKIVCFSDKFLNITMVNKEQNTSINIEYDGYFYNKVVQDINDLISFVGQDFTEEKKQPRIFTYEGYLNEFNINKGGNLKNFKCKITVEELLND